MRYARASMASAVLVLAAMHPPAAPSAAPDAPWTGGGVLAEAVANDQRSPAGRPVGDEWHVVLEAVEATWRPRGPDGPAIVTPAFREVGEAPLVPGPLLRFEAGMPVQVQVTNRLPRTIHVRGLADRTSDRPSPQPGAPAFLFEAPLVLAPGETQIVRFTPTEAVTSFYFARLVPPAEGPGAPPTMIPGGIADEGAFMGAFVVDAPDTPPHADERVFMITRWGAPDEPGSLDTTWKMMVNGLSWPYSERLELSVGDTARWRIINASAVDHPMHLHGFFFHVEATGDTQADTVFAGDMEREVVTEIMQEYSTLRLSWTPNEPGNWLFHCHLVRHMGELQRFESERSAAPGAAASAADHASHETASHEPASHDMDGMAGLITGITVHPAPGHVHEDPDPVRRVDLWTGARPGVFGEAPELGFVVQDGSTVPAPDSVLVPGSPLVLTRGEPTEIFVHNRLEIPLSVHWHGLELRSLYDGVGNWSGMPGQVRPPIAPGGFQRVVITPPRAGTFFYHIHGEPGHELSQGLYGPFLVLEPGEALDPERDRVFTLGSRGANLDAAPAINGRTAPPPQRFERGEEHRLRFIHISPDDHKVVRLSRNEEPVTWQPLAKDGATLPAGRREPGAAAFEIGVGESLDFTWTPHEEGVYVLEVRTLFYPNVGGEIVQRVAFGVGPVTDEELQTAATGSDLPIVELSAGQAARYAGTFEGPLIPEPAGPNWTFAVWEMQGRLYATAAPRGAPDVREDYLIPLGNGRFTPGRWVDGLISALDTSVVLEFDDGAERVESLRIVQGGAHLWDLERAPGYRPEPAWLDALAGAFRAPETTQEFRVAPTGIPGGPPLVLRTPDGGTLPLMPISATRFLVVSPDHGLEGLRVVFEVAQGRPAGLRVLRGEAVLAELERMR